MRGPPQAAPYTCLSTAYHDERVSNPTVHYFGCLPRSRRRKFFDSLAEKSQQRIRREEDRIAKLRARLEIHPESDGGARLAEFKGFMAEYREGTGRPREATWPLPPSSFPALEEGVDAEVKAPAIFFKNYRPYTDPTLSNSFPHQKVTVKDLLAENPKDNPLMRRCDDDMVRYFHLPANNMIWVEEAIARYYHENRPDANDRFLGSKLRRSRTKTEMLLRQEFWQGQQKFEAHSEVHARNMRGMCDMVSLDQVATEILPKNMVLFMPYLHWETDRGRLRAANKIKQVAPDRLSIAELLKKAQNRLSRPPSPVEAVAVPVQPQMNAETGVRELRPRRRILGDVLRTAAALLEAMEFRTEEQLIVEFLHANPPLHPRRTLDQSYYGALKNTGTRDRDQVVYRATAPEQHGHDPCWETCKQCREDIRKIPRLIMVDQLWLWILDEKTLISAFPRTWGKSNPDPSAIHKNIRLRLKQARADEVSSAYDMALIIIDEASRVFFDRTKTNERQPNMVDMFAEAIRGVTYKQTAAFDQFLIYTDLASREYKRQRNADTATQNHLLNINSEGNLLKEVKDIMDEINIITRIKEEQQLVMESFVKNIRRALTPLLKGNNTSPYPTWDTWLGQRPAPVEDREEPLQLGERRERARLTLTRADHLLRDIHDRIFELNGLLENARGTSAALKDLLTLKQQQAGVIEAREAVKQAAETLKQGQSIMLFTLVTIVFLPLSFCATLFGMNAAEFNDGHLTFREEAIYMFPISAAVILISVTLAFGRNSLTTGFGRIIHSSVSLVYNTAVTWLMIKTGLYMLNRSLAVKANRLRDRENKITGAMRAEVMRETTNLEKMRAASTMRDIAKNGSRRTTEMFSPRTPRPLSPYQPSPSSPFLRGTKPKSYGQELEDVELGHRKTASSQLHLVPER